jgi:multidrug efflux pump subunit AcrA (membrane-fusion protein)
MKKVRRRWWIIGLVAIVVAAGATTGVLLLTGDDAQAVRYLTSTVGKGTVAQTVEADFTLVTTRSALTLTTSQSGVVMAVELAPGQALRSLQRVLTVSGIPVFALVSGTPLYENLSYGSENANVTALEKALKSHGYDPGEIDGYFDGYAQAALLQWQADENLDQTGIVDITRFIWVPKGGAIETVQVEKGSRVAAMTALASVVFPDELEAQAFVGQADISSLKKGQKAALTIDGHSDTTLTGTITSISEQPASSTSAAAGASSSASVTYAVTVHLGKLPPFARQGMTGSLTVTIAKRENVLVVPTSAIVGSSSTSYVRVMMDGRPVMRQVQTGMATASSTEITSGLAAGETVVTGTISSGTGTNASSGGSLLGGNREPGDGFPNPGQIRRTSSGGNGGSSGGGQ